MALTRVPSTVATGKSVHSVRRPDITAIKTVRGAKVSDIFLCAREKNRLSFNRTSPAMYPHVRLMLQAQTVDATPSNR